VSFESSGDMQDNVTRKRRILLYGVKQDQLELLPIFRKLRRNIVGITTGYGLENRGIGGHVLVTSRIATSHFADICSEANPASFQMGMGDKAARTSS
jgi:hypothetical protein